MSWKLDSLGMVGSPSTSDKFYQLLSQHQEGQCLKIFLPPFKPRFCPEGWNGWEAGEKTHTRLLEQGLGRLSIIRYLIITLEEGDTKLIL